VSPLSSGDRIGPYVVRDELGAGGMGRVYLAERPPDSDLFAVKVIRDELAADPVVTRRFLREARATAAVSHPRLIEVVESGESDELAYLAMRFVPGPSVDRAIEQRGPLGIKITHRLVTDVAGALDALHQAGLVHRDVKPSNIILSDDGHATLMDLGLIRGEGMSVLTQAGGIVGTLSYLAPELIRGDADASPASDIYALACVAFEALAGRPPFEGSVFEVGMGHLEYPPPDVHELRPELPETLSEALTLALAKEPERRPPTATAFAVMLRLGAGPG
jgi:serine/threonine protein kinase